MPGINNRLDTRTVFQKIILISGVLITRIHCTNNSQSFLQMSGDNADSSKTDGYANIRSFRKVLSISNIHFSINLFDTNSLNSSLHPFSHLGYSSKDCSNQRIAKEISTQSFLLS